MTEITTELVLKAQGGDEDANRAIVEGLHRPVIATIFRFLGPGYRREVEDLAQEVFLKVFRAIDKFDPGHGARLASLAIPEVLGAILNHLRDHGSLVKAPRDLRKNRIALAKATDKLGAWLGRGPTTAELAAECGLSEEDVNENLKFAGAVDPHSLDATLRPGANDGDSTALEFLGSED